MADEFEREWRKFYRWRIEFEWVGRRSFGLALFICWKGPLLVVMLFGLQILAGKLWRPPAEVYATTTTPGERDADAAGS